MIRTVGDHALVVDDARVVLHGGRGVLRTWPRMIGRDFDESVIRVATLADPPRLALHVGRGIGDVDAEPDASGTVALPGRLSPREPGPGASSFVEIVDVATGDTQSRTPWSVDGAFSWAPDGAALWIQTSADLHALDARGAALASIAASAIEGAADNVAFGPHGLALTHAARSSAPHLALVDVRAHRLAWSAAVPAARVVPSADFTRAAVLERRDDGDTVAIWDLERGQRLRAMPTRGSGVYRGLWADPTVDLVIALDSAGVLRTTRASLATSSTMLPETTESLGFLDTVDIDVVRGLALEPAIGAVRLYRLLSERICAVNTGARNDLARACFTPRAVPVAVVDGAVNKLGTNGARVVEGPTHLVELAPHPRGVVAVDVDGCAHVVEIEAAP